MIIAIDFDGTICRSTFPTIEGTMPGAKEVISRLHAGGHYIRGVLLIRNAEISKKQASYKLPKFMRTPTICPLVPKTCLKL